MSQSSTNQSPAPVRASDLHPPSKGDAEKRLAVETMARSIAAMRSAGGITEGYRMMGYATGKAADTHDHSGTDDLSVEYPPDSRIVAAFFTHRQPGGQSDLRVVPFPADYLDGSDCWTAREVEAIAGRMAIDRTPPPVMAGQQPLAGPGERALDVAQDHCRATGDDVIVISASNYRPGSNLYHQFQALDDDRVSTVGDAADGLAVRCDSAAAAKKLYERLCRDGATSEPTLSGCSITLIRPEFDEAGKLEGTRSVTHPLDGSGRNGDEAVVGAGNHEPASASKSPAAQWAQRAAMLAGTHARSPI